MEIGSLRGMPAGLEQQQPTLHDLQCVSPTSRLASLVYRDILWTATEGQADKTIWVDLVVVVKT